jgi:hypothetical protein
MNTLMKKIKTISIKEREGFTAVVKVGGEPVGVISRPTKAALDAEVTWFKKACKEIWKGEVVTVKYR